MTPYSPSLLSLPALSQIHGLFLINYSYIHLNVHSLIYIPRYYPLDLYNAACVHEFRADHLVLDYQLACSSLE